MAKLLLLVSILGFAIRIKPTTYVTVQPMQPVSTAHQKVGETKISINIMKGFHIQANPASSKNLIPTTLTFDPVEGIIWGEPKYPPGKPYRMAKALTDISVYEGVVAIGVPFEIKATAPHGLQNTSATIRYQACDDKNCFFPNTLSIKVPLKIE